MTLVLVVIIGKLALSWELNGKIYDIEAHGSICDIYLYMIHSPIKNMAGSPPLNKMGLQKQ